MTERIHHTNVPVNRDELGVSSSHHAEALADGGNVLAILASSNRVVLKSGRLAGGRACALSARAASRGIQPSIPRL
jgi:hypothetical protein